ncbi:MAG: TetR family transcriptional regulator [Polyangiales bacterium]
MKKKLREPEPLSDQQIVEAALQLIRRDGADRLSMRKLAKELGVTPMAIYYYVPNKDALFERVSDAVMARIPKPTPTGVAWRQELSAYAVRGWQLLLEYPGLSSQLAKRPPSTQSEQLVQYGLSILHAAGFEPPTAALAITSYHAFMMGVIGMQAQLAHRNPRGRRSTSPSTSYLRKLDFRELVDFGISAILGGLNERLHDKRRPAAAKKKTTRRPDSRTLAART